MAIYVITHEPFAQCDVILQFSVRVRHRSTSPKLVSGQVCSIDW